MTRNASAKAITEIANRWGDKPCEHDAGLLKEYIKGMATNDYACEICGETRWGSGWNHNKDK
jgi:hypothetical protein